jgi:hypothetical protein
MSIQSKLGPPESLPNDKATCATVDAAEPVELRGPTILGR